jgi:short-subunit dehydrogenase
MAAKVLVICGYGPGISNAAAKKFGSEGFSLALVARNAERLDAAVEELRAENITCRAFPCDLSSPANMEALFGQIRESLGPITVIHWNACMNGVGGDILTSKPEQIQAVLNVGCVSMIAAVQAVISDMKAQSGTAAVLITGGGLGFHDSGADQFAIAIDQMALALVNSGKHKLGDQFASP